MSTSHFGMSTRHFGMSTVTFTILLIYYFSLPGSFLASRGFILACRRRQRGFGMSTGTTLLACRRYFWHVDASYPRMQNASPQQYRTKNEAKESNLRCLLRCCSVLGSNNYNSYSVFWTAPIKKHWYLHAFNHVEQEACLHAKITKHL